MRAIGCKCGECSQIGAIRDWWWWNFAMRWITINEFELRKAKEQGQGWLRYAWRNRRYGSLHPVQFYCVEDECIKLHDCE